MKRQKLFLKRDDNMATIIKASSYIKINEDFVVILSKDSNDQTLLGKKCSLYIIKLDECSLYDHEYYFNGICTEDRGQSMVQFKIDLNEGIYALAGFSNNITGDEYNNSFYQNMHPFQVFNDAKQKLVLSQLIEIKDAKQNEYRNLQEKGLGNQQNSLNSYTCYVFAIDIYIGKELKLGTATISPIKRLDPSYLKNYMRDILLEKKLVYNYPFSKKSDSFDDPYSQPSILIEIHNVYADNEEEASKTAYEYSERIVRNIALLNNSHGTIIGDTIINQKTKQTFSRNLYYSYLGNLFVGMESPNNLKRYLDSSKKNGLHNFYINLYHGAMKERDNDMKRFKLWNLLETISLNKDYIGKPMINLTGELVLSIKKKTKMKINSESINLVRELVRNYIEKSKANILLADNLTFSSMEDRIKIWNQRRNCVAHRGKCIYQQSDYCDGRNDKMEKCKQVELMLHISSTPTVDDYIFNLKNLVRDIVIYEITEGI